MFYDHLTIRSKASVVRNFDVFCFGPISLSVQAGYGMYSSPRETLDDLSKYNEWEIALLAGGEGMLGPEDFGRHLPPEVLDFLSFWQTGSVCGYVATAKVQRLFDLLCCHYGMPKGVPARREGGALEYRLGHSATAKEAPVRVNIASLRRPK